MFIHPWNHGKSFSFAIWHVQLKKLLHIWFYQLDVGTNLCTSRNELIGNESSSSWVTRASIFAVPAAISRIACVMVLKWKSHQFVCVSRHFPTWFYRLQVGSQLEKVCNHLFYFIKLRRFFASVHEKFLSNNSYLVNINAFKKLQTALSHIGLLDLIGSSLVRTSDSDLEEPRV